MKPIKTIALAGNPNVGKSTIFNSLTGMKQHTGNWPGKTVANAQGYYTYKDQPYILVDLPGTYSLIAHSVEEEIAGDYLKSKNPDAVIVVCDSTCLERNLNLVLQILQITPKVVVCVNLMDEAKKKGIHINLELLSEKLGIPVVGTIAHKKNSLDDLMENVYKMTEGKASAYVIHPLSYTQSINCTSIANFDESCITAFIKTAESLCQEVITADNPSWHFRDRKLDQILTSRIVGYPVMIALLTLLLWLTITGANYPSQLLSSLLFQGQELLTKLFAVLHAPEWLHGILVLGIYRVVAWVVSVMLPPMAIFFPLFTLLEDAGYLPRIAYNLDKPFQCCHACGKQSLTMCMGFGCNAVGVTGCRIIDSPRERLLAILTNSFVPCNGRFPMLIALLTIFFSETAGGMKSSLLTSLMLTGIILLGIGMTFAATWLLSVTLLKGIPSSFTLELPPYRMPQVGTILIRSIFDRTLFVLGRAAAVAAPAGILIWLMANIIIQDTSLLNHCASFLDPFAKLMGLDGVILIAFFLGFPANEIVMPIILMAYLAQGSMMEPESLTAMKALLTSHGWTWTTAASTMLFSLMHWPCSTTLLTIHKETGNLRWTGLAVLLPTAAGIICCVIFTSLTKFF